MYECRPLENTDIDSVCRLPRDQQELFYMFPRASYPLTREQMIRQIHKRNNSTVVTDGDRVIAYANIYQLETGVKCFIGNLVVDDGYRGQGVASLLIRHMLQLAIEQHRVKEIHLSVFEDNVSASALYPKLGFQFYAGEEKTNPAGEKVVLKHMKIGSQMTGLLP